MVQVVAAVVWRGDDLLLVRELIGGEMRWSLPGGGVEPGELLTEALRREVREESGLAVDEPDGVAFVVHHDTPRYPSAILVALAYRVAGDDMFGPDDPAHKVVDARFFSVPDAVAEMSRGDAHRPHYEPPVAYLLQQAPAGTTWLYRRRHGEDRLVGRLEPSGP